MNGGYNGGIPVERIVNPFGKNALAIFLGTLAIVRSRGDDFKAIPPDECRIEAKFSKKNEFRRATATLYFRFKTTRSLQTVGLGMAGVTVKSAEFQDRHDLPDLMTSEKGVTLRPKDAGEYGLIVEVEPTVEVKNGGFDRGWSLPLPGAVMTTFSISAGQEVPDDLTISSFIYAGRSVVKRLSSSRSLSPVALGAARLVDCHWQEGPIPTNARERLDSQIEVLASSTSVLETHRLAVVTTRKRLEITVPKDSKITVDPQDERSDAVKISVVSPSLVRAELPESGNWSFHVSRTITRNDTFIGAIIPCRIQGIDAHVGKIRLVAEPTSRIEPGVQDRVRIIEERNPITGKADRRYVFTASDDQPVLTYRTIRRPGSIRSRPIHRLALVEQRWQWRASFRLTPRNRDVLELELNVPKGWSTVRIGPDDSIDEIATNERTDGSRSLTIRLVSSTMEPVELTMDASYPAGPDKESIVPMPCLKDVNESDGRVIVSVPEPHVVTCVVRSDGRDMLPVFDGTTDLEPKSRQTLASDLPIEAVRIHRSVDRPPLRARLTAETVLHDRQAVIRQTIHLRADRTYPRPIRLTIPADAAGFRVQPTPVSIQGRTVIVPWPAQESEFEISLSYALPRPGEISLVWPEDATDSVATIHAWGAPGTRLQPPSSDWKIEPTAAVSNRPTFPWLSITTTRAPDSPAPIWRPLEQPADDDDAPDVTIDAATVAVWPHEDRRFRLRCLVSMKINSGFNVSLPDPEDVEIWIDGRKLESPIPTAIQPRNGFLTVRISLPETRQTTPLILEFRGHQNLPIIERSRLLGPVHWVFAQDLQSWILPFDRTLNSVSRWVFRNGRLGLTDGGSDVRLIPNDSDWPRTDDEPTAASNRIDRWPFFISMKRWPSFIFATISSVFLMFGAIRKGVIESSRFFIYLFIFFGLFSILFPFTTIKFIELNQYGIILCIFIYIFYMIRKHFVDKLSSFSVLLTKSKS
jgi:hypothetical protein